MADSVNIFIDTDLSLEQIATELGILLQLTFESQQDEYEKWYAVRNEEGLFTIGTHDFEGDDNMPFKNYKYEMAFWVNRDKPSNEREDIQQEVGEKVFEKLKVARKYALLYVFDVQKKIAEYKP
jgi:hypothetical protein